jgi:hypothetical protein
MSEGLLVNALALIAVAGYVARQAYPATEAVRIRNAFLLEPSTAADFEWTPRSAPATFRREHRPPSPEFIEIVRRLGLGSLRDDWERALAIAGHLSEVAADRGRIQSDLATTYHRIREGYGYCADFVRVFLALAHAAGIFARQWAFSLDGFGGHGHTFVEVYDGARGRWFALDVHNNFHFADAASGEPLGALEIRKALSDGQPPMTMRPNGPGRVGYVRPEKALDYYRRGLDEWYLWWGNAVFSYEAQPLVALARRMSDWLAHLAAHLTGVQPRIRILPTSENEPQRRRMASLKARLGWAAALAVLLGGGLLVQIGLSAGAPMAR